MAETDEAARPQTLRTARSESVEQPYISMISGRQLINNIVIDQYYTTLAS
jgi:hypothetical protein